VSCSANNKQIGLFYFILFALFVAYSPSKICIQKRYERYATGD